METNNTLEEGECSKVESDNSIQEVIAVIKKSETIATSIQKNLLYFLVTIILFIGFGFFKNPIIDLTILIGVILFHELGHLLAMKLTGYNDIKMFFVPLFGAAVLGKNKNVSGVKRTIVVFAGPAPGIIAGIVFLFIYLRTHNYLFGKIALSLLFINTLNLLPVFPLDGGRILHNIIFCRNKYIEAVFMVIAGVSLVFLGIYINKFLVFLGIIIIISVRYSFKIAKLVEKLNKEIDAFSLTNSLLELPQEIIEKIIFSVKSEFSNIKNSKKIADSTKTLWERINFKKPKIAVSILLFIFYLCTLIIAIFFFMLTLYSTAYQTEIKTGINSNGNKTLRSSTYFFGSLIKEIDVNSSGIYNGAAVYYYKGKKIQSGEWHLGEKNGQWNDYDKSGNVITQSYYKNGKFIYREPKTEKDWSMSLQYTLPQFTNKDKIEKEVIGN